MVLGLVFLTLGVVILLINLFVIPVELVEERGRKKENVKKWDKILTSVNMISMLGIYIVSGLDYRFGWSSNPNILLHITGLVFYFLGSMLFYLVDAVKQIFFNHGKNTV